MKNIVANQMSERRATWLELFFDLVFVVAIGALADFVRQASGLYDVLYFIAYFLPVWWIWMGFSYYADQFETNDFLHKCVFLAAMFLILALAVSINNQGLANPKPFVISYISLRLLLWVLYARAWYLESEFRTFLGFYLTGFGIGILLWGLSLLLPNSWHFYCWGLAMLVELLAPILSYVLLNKFPTQVSHMDERFGLFVLIVLGEMVVLIGSSLSQTHFHLHLVLLCFLGLLIIFQVWQLYFTNADQNVIHQSLRGGKIALAKSFVYGYNHFCLFVSLVMLAVGIGRLLDQGSLTHFTQNMILLSSSSFLLIISMIHWAMPDGISTKKLALRLIAALVLFGLCLAHLSAMVLLLVLAGILGGLIVFG
ncbi:MAG: low temperature requirement [Gammaproteobacteria bacterium]|nr:low temperature requirement [Gammaproteobacteria bacterium]